jgi:purine nucleoside phosphorylase
MRDKFSGIIFQHPCSLRANLKVGSFTLPEQLIDFSKQVWTYHDKDIFHADFAEPINL